MSRIASQHLKKKGKKEIGSYGPDLRQPNEHIAQFLKTKKRKKKKTNQR